MEPKAIRVVSPGEGPDPGAISARGVRGPARRMGILPAPGRLCPLCPRAKWVVRPQTDEILSSWNPSAVVCRREWGYGCDFISCPVPHQMSLSSTTRLPVSDPPPSAEGGKIKSRAGAGIRLTCPPNGTLPYLLCKRGDKISRRYAFKTSFSLYSGSAIHAPAAKSAGAKQGFARSSAPTDTL